jgi:Cdc6-like AAA superfamily ATPase
MLEIAVVRPLPPLYEWKEMTSMGALVGECRRRTIGEHFSTAGADHREIVYNPVFVVPDFDRQKTLDLLFSPSAPVEQQQLFAGRQTQMDSLLQTINRVGQHAVIFGERGVGKTSLARTMFENLRGTDIPALAICDSTDSFSSIWRKALGRITFSYEVKGTGFSPQKSEAVVTAADRLPVGRDLTPDDIKNMLELVGKTGDVVIVMDEFDRLDDTETKRLFAETMKMVSDWRISATLILVGVADDVEGLISGHASVERGMAQILMPRMSTQEMEEIVERVQAVKMTISEDAKSRITRLSQGLPHYTHLLAQSAALAADDRDSAAIDIDDVELATRSSIEQMPASITRAYHRATTSPQKTLYPQIFLACALTRRDELGYFSPADVRAPLSAIMGKQCETQMFSRHLNELANPSGERGRMLQKSVAARTSRFRFVNPLLQPFAIMKGVADGIVNDELLEQFGVDVSHASM